MQEGLLEPPVVPDEAGAPSSEPLRFFFPVLLG